MGMFDTINEELFCPFCGEKQEKGSFQTKDLSNMLSNWTFKEIADCYEFEDRREFINIHTPCKKCKRRISLLIRIGDLIEELKNQNVYKG